MSILNKQLSEITDVVEQRIETCKEVMAHFSNDVEKDKLELVVMNLEDVLSKQKDLIDNLVDWDYIDNL